MGSDTAFTPRVSETSFVMGAAWALVLANGPHTDLTPPGGNDLPRDPAAEQVQVVVMATSSATSTGSPFLVVGPLFGLLHGDRDARY